MLNTVVSIYFCVETIQQIVVACGACGAMTSAGHDARTRGERMLNSFRDNIMVSIAGTVVVYQQ